MKKINALKFFLPVWLFLLVGASLAWAATGFDVNPAGFGPVIKGFQLGVPENFDGFFAKTLELESLKSEWDFIFKASNYGMSVSAKPGDGQSWQLSGLISDGSQNREFKGTIADLARLCEEAAKKCPEVGLAHIEGRGFSNTRIAMDKQNGGELRYCKISISEVDFGAKGMPGDEFAKALTENYQLGKLEKTPAAVVDRYSTSESDAYKNGWRAIIVMNSITLEACDVQGETSFN